MENKGILVIGGTGYIGKVLVKKLYDENIEFSSLVRKFSNNKSNFKEIKGNVLDKNSLMSATNNKKMIIYLATSRKKNKKDCFNVNVNGLKNTLEAMRINKVKKIIYFSTKNVNLNKRDNYSETKRIAEDILLRSNLEYVILKPDYVYGIDEENILSKLIRFVLNFKIFPIFGKGGRNFYPVNKKFVAEVCIDFINKFKRGAYEISGEKISFDDIAKLLKKASKKKFLIIHIPIIFGEIICLFLPYSPSIFREDRIFSKKNNFVFKTFKKDLEEIVKLINKK